MRFDLMEIYHVYKINNMAQYSFKIIKTELTDRTELGHVQ